MVSEHTRSEGVRVWPVPTPGPALRRDKPLRPRKTHLPIDADKSVQPTPAANKLRIASAMASASTFNSLSKVLCTFPSRYLFAIGFEAIHGALDETYHQFGALLPESTTRRVPAEREQCRALIGIFTRFHVLFQGTTALPLTTAASQRTNTPL